MATKNEIMEILNRLGTNSALTDIQRLATDIKQKQKETKNAIEACINLIQVLSNTGNQMQEIVAAARKAEGRESEYIQELNSILSNSPTQQEVETVINQLRQTVGEQRNINPEFGDSLLPEQKTLLNINDPPVVGQGNSGAPANERMFQGGYDWRSNSKKKTLKSKSKTKRKTKSRRSSKKGGKNRNRTTRGRGRVY